VGLKWPVYQMKWLIFENFMVFKKQWQSYNRIQQITNDIIINVQFSVSLQGFDNKTLHLQRHFVPKGSSYTITIKWQHTTRNRSFAAFKTPYRLEFWCVNYTVFFWDRLHTEAYVIVQSSTNRTSWCSDRIDWAIPAIMFNNDYISKRQHLLQIWLQS
jgi:hypothetical protein